jgi:ABC-2 type transport system ATP-binding protein
LGRLAGLLPTNRALRASLAGVLVLVLIGLVLAIVLQPAAIKVSSQFLAGTPEPDGKPVALDTSLYLPATTPAPAVLLAHGLGGTKAGLDAQARDLARHGYLVLTYTARGFGSSGGLIHLDSVNYEVKDASRLLDFLQDRSDVLHRDGKPVLGVAGSSYGGALALMLGATDHRVEAVAADITWNNLTNAVFPNNVAAGASAGTGGVFKKLWVGYLFSISMRPGATGTPAPTASGTDAAGCGRFAPDICAFYQRTGSSPNGVGPSSQASQSSALLSLSSPSTVLSGIKAPVLLTQGEQDSLFPLSEADANARQIVAAGAPLQMRWRSGGHDAGNADDNVSGWQRQFFDQRLRGMAANSDGNFFLAQRDAGISATNGRRVNTTLRANDGYPGAGHPAPVRGLPLTGVAQTISAPPGGSPAAVTSLPALSGVLNAAAGAGISTSALSALPGQVASFRTAPLTAPVLVTGSSTVELSVTSPDAKEATLFVSLHDVAADGTDTLPANLVAPVQITLAGGRQNVTLRLPWIVSQIPAGHRLSVQVSTTDFGYAMPGDPRSYRVSLDAANSVLTVPSLATTTIRTGTVLWWPVLAGIVLLLCAALLAWRLRSMRRSTRDAGLAGVPIAVTDLVKEYADSYRAVDGVSFRVERGQVLGLLGPNGAGKTTVLRVLMGLIMPTSGTVRVFGVEVTPGAPVLSRLGAFVEGPGLLPHLTGSENLRLYWAATGRPTEQAHLDTVLEIAGLGSSIDRRVKTYSHGMQQRLAIAQAMLGLPEVLVLDEPTNGLDPPQIAEMRVVLRRYAETGRTVIVSSHLLAEVEQTCSHVVVMHRGRVVAAGSVTEVAGVGAVQLAVDDPVAAANVLAEAGISAREVPARRALEDVFLDLTSEST